MVTRAEFCADCKTMMQQRITLLSTVDHKIVSSSTLKKIKASGQDGCPLCTWLGIEFEASPSFKKSTTGEDIRNVELRVTFNAYERSGRFNKARDTGEREICMLSITIDHKASNYVITNVDICIETIRTSPVKWTMHETNTGSHSSISLAKKWLNLCVLSHTDCKSKANPDWRPSRLVEVVRQRDGSVATALREAKLEDYRPGVAYLTLSHRWLPENGLELTTVNRDQLRSQISNDKVKAAIRDAFVIVMHLGHRYLWVDSLCIVQDDPQDLELEISQMDSVFRNSSCTIAAGASDGPEKGCFFTRAASHLDSFVVKLDLGHGMPQEFLMRRSPWEGYREIRSCVLSRRGWIFQERFLSRRTLFFCRGQVYWQCTRLQASETYPEGQPIELGQVAGSSRTVFDGAYSEKGADLVLRLYRDWTNILAEYTRCSLTFDADRLQAIAGVAAFFKARCSDEYIEGIWRSTMPQALLWSVPHVDISEQKRLPAVAPSWSWASMSSSVDNRTPVDRTQTRVQVVDIITKAATGVMDQTSTLRTKARSRPKAVLHLRGHPWTASLVDQHSTYKRRCQLESYMPDDAREGSQTAVLDRSEDIGLGVACLPVMTVQRPGEVDGDGGGDVEIGLVLAPERMRESPSVYRRIGVYQCQVKSELAFKGRKQDVCIC